MTASRPAISLPSAVPASSTAAGDFSATSEASSSAFGATTYSANSPESATYTRAAPNSASRSRPCSAPGPAHTTDGLAQPGRRGQQLAGDLLDLPAGVLGQNQYLSHAQTLLR